MPLEVTPFPEFLITNNDGGGPLINSHFLSLSTLLTIEVARCTRFDGDVLVSYIENTLTRYHPFTDKNQTYSVEAIKDYLRKITSNSAIKAWVNQAFSLKRVLLPETGFTADEITLAKNSLAAAATAGCEVILAQLIKVIPKIELFSFIVTTISASPSTSKTLFDEAIHSNNVESLKLLLSVFTPKEQRILILHPNKYGDTLFHEAIHSNNVESLKLLLSVFTPKEQRILILNRNKYGDTLFHEAVDFNKAESLKFLLSAFTPEEQRKLILHPNKYGDTLLHTAIDFNKAEIFKLLLSVFTPEEQRKLIRHPNKYGNTLLHTAIDANKAESLKFLLSVLTPEEQRTLIQTQDDSGKTLLHMVSYPRMRKWFKEIIRLNKESFPDNTEVLQYLLSIFSARKEELCALLQVQDNKGNTPFHEAARNSHTDILQLLLSVFSDNKEELCALLQVQDNKGNTPFHEAARYSKPLNVKTIFLSLTEKQRLAALQFQNYEGLTPLNYIISSTNLIDNVLFLLQEENRLKVIQSLDRHGKTLIHYAVALNRPAMVFEILSTIPPDKCLEVVKIQNKDGRSALIMAFQFPETLGAILAFISKDQAVNELVNIYKLEPGIFNILFDNSDKGNFIHYSNIFNWLFKPGALNITNTYNTSFLGRLFGKSHTNLSMQMLKALKVAFLAGLDRILAECARLEEKRALLADAEKLPIVTHYFADGDTQTLKAIKQRAAALTEGHSLKI